MGRGFGGVGSVAAVMVGQLVVRHLLQSTTIPPGFTTTTCATGVYDCGNPNLSCSNGTIFMSGKVVVSSSSGLPKSCTNGCAPYNDKYESPSSMLWTVIVGGFFCAGMAYLIGGNDAANSWATSVGSRAIALRPALIIGALCEWAGATALGYGVSGSITRGVAKTSDKNCWACGYCNSKIGLYPIAMLSALIAANIFLFIATFTAYPVSTTHSIIGGVVGGTVVAVGFGCLNWSFSKGLGGIAASWVISPLASGGIGAALWLVTYYLVIKSPFPCGPAKTALIAMPLEYALGGFIIVLLIMLKSLPTKNLSTAIQVGSAAGAGALCALASALIMVPLAMKALALNRDKIRFPGEDAALTWPDDDGNWWRRITIPKADVNKQLNELEEKAAKISALQVKSSAAAETVAPPDGENIDAEAALDKPATTKEVDDGPHAEALGMKIGPNATSRAEVVLKDEKFGLEEHWEPEEREAIFVYRYLLVFVAALESFAHGSNDTGNATGAFSAILTTYQGGFYGCTQKATPWYVMTVAGFFVGLGVYFFGYRVIRTIGQEMANINYHRGYCMEFASALTVVVCTYLALPVSTTHCQVGAVVFVGVIATGWKHVKWGLFGKIGLTWVATIPTSALLSAAFTALLGLAVKN